MIPFGEVGMFKVITDDKYEDRWEKGIFVGKSEETDEFFYLTEAGFKKSRSCKRPCESERFDVALLAKVKGTPMDPTGTSNSCLLYTSPSPRD